MINFVNRGQQMDPARGRPLPLKQLCPTPRKRQTAPRRQTSPCPPATGGCFRGALSPPGTSGPPPSCPHSQATAGHLCPCPLASFFTIHRRGVSLAATLKEGLSWSLIPLLPILPPPDEVTAGWHFAHAPGLQRVSYTSFNSQTLPTISNPASFSCSDNCCGFCLLIDTPPFFPISLQELWGTNITLCQSNCFYFWDGSYYAALMVFKEILLPPFFT